MGGYNGKDPHLATTMQKLAQIDQRLKKSVINLSTLILKLNLPQVVFSMLASSSIVRSLELLNLPVLCVNL